MLASLLAVFAGAALAGEAPSPSHAALRAGLEARMHGDDARALKHFERCRKLAAPGSPDADSCDIYREWLTTDRAKEPGTRQGVAAYRSGVKAYRKGDLLKADALWHRCLELETGFTQAKRDCMAMIDLIPRKPLAADEAPAREDYLLGVAHYGAGRETEAWRAWMKCLESAPEGSGTASDCRAGLDKIEADAKKP